MNDPCILRTCYLLVPLCLNRFAILSFKNNQSLTHELQGIFPSSLMRDPQHILDGMLVLRCFFCDSFQTPIEFDILHY
jgi:hypothetical protein